MSRALRPVRSEKTSALNHDQGKQLTSSCPQKERISTVFRWFFLRRLASVCNGPHFRRKHHRRAEDHAPQKSTGPYIPVKNAEALRPTW